MDLHRVEIDWATIDSPEQMWEEIVEQSGHPAWHGRNLDALYDGWVTDGLDEFGPPYEFVFLNCEQVGQAMQDLSEHVMEIGALSVQENGGTIRMSKVQVD